jgi:RND superfamily putative drug exporter
MLTRVGRFSVSHRRAVLAATAVLVLAAAVVGGGVAKRLSTSGFFDPQSESSRADRLLDQRFHQGPPNLVLLVTPTAGRSVDDPAIAAAGVAVTRQLASERYVRRAVSYWTLDSAPPLRARNGRSALVVATIAGNDDQVNKRVNTIADRFTFANPTITVAVGGQAQVFRQVGDQIEKDLLRAEAIAVPITLVLLVVIFGGLIAASLPLVTGLAVIFGGFLVLFVVSSMTSVSVYSLNLVTAMGLGLAIDYSLFIVSRYREELANGRDVEAAVVRTVQTAGRTVTGSAFTVAVSLAALLLFHLSFLRSFAYAGIAVSLLAAATAVVFLPALLAVLGPRVNALQLWTRHPKPVGQGVWHRVATTVMRRPIPIAAVVIAVLVLLGLPFLRINLGLPDDRVLPTTATSRQVQDHLRAQYSSNESAPLRVVASHASLTTAGRQAIGGYAATLSRIRGVGRVDAATGSYIAGHEVPVPPQLTQQFQSGGPGTWLSVVPTVEPESSAGETLVKAVRHTHPPASPVLVSGRSAQLVDSKASLFASLPWAGAWIAISMFVLLFLMFGSVVVPIKALVLNLLSLTATFGAMVWIFQEGHLSGLLNFTATGSLSATMPILMFCVAFGLSMDYEVFLLSRIKEEHDRTHDNISSVAIGLERTGRIVTAAAVLISVVFLAFATSNIAFIKLFGVGMALAVLMDAFVIRATLVPAFMRLAGELNWWAPKPLRRLHARIGFAEPGDLAPPTPSEPTTARVREPAGVR